MLYLNRLCSCVPFWYRFDFTGDERMCIILKIKSTEVIVSDIYRGNQSKGTAGKLLSEALRMIGITKPKSIIIENILSTQPTLLQIEQGIPISETVLGNTLKNTCKELNGTILSWEKGEERGKPWIKVLISYD